MSTESSTSQLPDPTTNPALQVEVRYWTCKNGISHSINLTCDCDTVSNITGPIVDYSLIIYWPCGNCNFGYNIFDNAVCAKCGLNQQHTWTCSHCVCASNNGRMDGCGECFEKRCQSAVRDSPSEAIYSCGDCGAVTSVTRDVCYKCYEPKP